MPKIIRFKTSQYITSMLSVVLVTAILFTLRGRINATSVALSFVVVVLLIAAILGSRPAYLASVLGGFAFNYFFLPPFHTLLIADPQNWVALLAFITTGVIAGELSARARKRAEEAEAGRQEIQLLYNELRGAFERASQAEALRQSERLKSALLDAVTHDLRTPLTSIKAAVTTLLGQEGKGGPWHLDQEAKRDLLEVIDDETERLNRFVENLVQIARIEAGEMELRKRWVALDEIITPALHRLSAQTANHHVEVAIEKDLPSVRVDAATMAEVVYVLVENAAKYSPNGTSIRISAVPGPEGNIQVVIEDEGSGIPPEMHERVFDKFFRIAGDGSSAKKPGGLGMGLAIARGIVEAHGGRIWIESSPGGKGTRMAFMIPIGEEEPRKEAAAGQILKQL